MKDLGETVVDLQNIELQEVISDKNLIWSILKVLEVQEKYKEIVVEILSAKNNGVKVEISFDGRKEEFFLKSSLKQIGGILKIGGFNYYFQTKKWKKIYSN